MFLILKWSEVKNDVDKCENADYIALQNVHEKMMPGEQVKWKMLTQLKHKMTRNKLNSKIF